MKEISVRISKDGTLTLPKEIKDEFKNSSVTLLKMGDKLVIAKDLKEKPQLSLSEMADRLIDAGNKITQEDIEEAIREVRAEELKRRFK